MNDSTGRWPGVFHVPWHGMVPGLLQTTEVIDRVMAMDWPGAPVAVQGLLHFVIARASRPTSLWCWRVFRVALPSWLQVREQRRNRRARPGEAAA